MTEVKRVEKYLDLLLETHLKEREVLLTSIDEAHRDLDAAEERATCLERKLSDTRIQLAKARARAEVFARKLIELGVLPSDFETLLPEHARLAPLDK